MSKVEVLAERRPLHVKPTGSRSTGHGRLVDQGKAHLRLFLRPTLVLVSLLAVTLVLALRIGEWDDPAPPYHELHVTVGRVSHVKEKCTGGATGPAGPLGPPVCYYSIVLDDGGQFLFPYPDARPNLTSGSTAEISHAPGSGVWEVRTGQAVLASYEGVTEFRAQRTRFLRRSGILGCLAMLAIASGSGFRRLRAGPCSCREPRLLDHASLVALFVASSAILRDQLELAVMGTLVAFLAFKVSIRCAAGHPDMDAATARGRNRGGSFARRIRQSGLRLERWATSIEAVAQDTSASRAWRSAATLWKLLFCVGLVIPHCVGMQVFFSLMSGAPVDPPWSSVMGAAAVSTVCLLMAGLLGSAVRRRISTESSGACL